MLQTDMSWHCTTLHEMYNCKSMFAKLGSDIFSCIYPQIQDELLICIVKFNNTVTSNHVSCHHCVTVLPSCGVTWVLKPEARIATHLHLLFQLICYLNKVSWPMGVTTFQCELLHNCFPCAHASYRPVKEITYKPPNTWKLCWCEK